LTGGRLHQKILAPVNPKQKIKMKILKDQQLCKCGHKRQDHSSWGTACYVMKHLKGSHYQCTCKTFEEVEK
jgi:hypothetical protein